MALRQVVPVGSAAQHPQDTVDETVIVGCGTPSVTGYARQEVPEHGKLFVVQFVAFGHLPPLT